jgi:energy-coupling factor transporter transmembrane protein EcfT
LKNNININNNDNNLKILTFFLIIGFGFWFLLSPVYRFGIIYFLVLIFISTVQFYRKKIFSKKIFLTLLCFFLFFNFSKNISRIIQKNYIVFGIDNVNNEYIIYDDYIANKTISVFRPNIKVNNFNGNGWQGRLCWDIPFICSYNKIKVNLISNYNVISKLN